MLRVVYCERPGCGKEVGAQRWEHDKVVEQEWVDGHCTEDVVDDDMNVVTTKHFCSIECANKKDDFVTPEEVEDANANE